jgi:dipeptidyl aminopeptidase/acylaminoacyl peptidase
MRTLLALNLTAMLVGAGSAGAGNGPQSLPSFDDFRMFAGGAELPHFDRTGEFLVWCRLDSEGWELLRAKIDAVGDPIAMLQQPDLAACRRQSWKGVAETDELTRLAKGYRLRIFPSNGGQEDIDIPLDVQLSVFLANDRGEAILGAKEQDQLVFYRVDGVRAPYRIPNAPREVTGAYDDDLWPALKLSAADGKTGILEARVSGKWQRIRSLPLWNLRFFAIPGQNFSPEFALQINAVYAILWLDNGTAQIVRINLSNGKIEPIVQDPRYDILSFEIDRKTDQLDDYVTANPDPRRPAVHFQVPRDKERLNYLASILPGRIETVERNPTKDVWLLGIDFDQRPSQAILYDWRTRSVLGSMDLLAPRATMERLMPVVETRLVEIPTRDGADLDGFLTLPASSGSAAHPARLVVDLHGGPGEADSWEYAPEVMFLASRGYAVLRINYRGSFGRGLGFMGPGYILKGTAITDAMDALAWATGKGYAAPGRIAVMGQSFGGYLAAAVAARGPPDLACAVSVSGAYDLVEMIEGVQRPHDWFASRLLTASMLGTAESAEDRAALMAESPLSHVDEIGVPLLLEVSPEEDVLNPDQALRFTRSLDSAGHRPILISFDNAHHSDYADDDLATLYNVIDSFLSKCLGGPAAPLDAAAIARSSMRVLSDNGMVSTLKDAVPAYRYSAGLPAEDVRGSAQAR